MKGKEFLAQLKMYNDYMKWLPEKGRYETWDEACENVLNTHILNYGNKIKPYLEEILPHYKERGILVSQRNLQFRGVDIAKHNARLYNCCTTYCNTPDVFSKGFYILLCGTGLGVNMFPLFVKNLPYLHRRIKGTQTYTISDSIEGWADAIHILISSYCSHPSLDESYFGYIINFDYSLIRPKGSKVSGGFKAPGHEGLKQSLERIESLIDYEIDGEDFIPFRSIIAYDIFMHISDAVLSGGVRRSAMNIIMSPDDEELVYAKIGNWREKYPWRARSNNSIGLMRNKFSSNYLQELLELNEGDNDLGFVFMNNPYEIYNPCYEIGFNFWNQIEDYNHSAFQFCNLTEINAGACKDKNGSLDESKFYELCRVAAIAGTLQAGWSNFTYLNKQTEKIVEGEALLGVSITGWFDNPGLFNEEILKQGARIVKETNSEVASFIKINPAARLTCVKPSGNASVLLKTSSGIHGEHSHNYFRIMQINKDSEVAKWLVENKEEMLEESVWSATKTDWVVFVPCSISKESLTKDDLKGILHMEKIKLVQNSWVKEGKNKELCYHPDIEHNVSCTIIIDDIHQITDYLYNNQDYFTAVAFISNFGDKDYNQAPFTSVLDSQELLDKYGDGVMFMSGLVVDALHYFNNNLWDATEYILNPDKQILGTREQTLLRKDWLRRAKKFAKNYMKGDLKQTVYCMKDVHLWHKWNNVLRGFKIPDFTEILKQPTYREVSDYAAIACSGNQCEIV